MQIAVALVVPSVLLAGLTGLLGQKPTNEHSPVRRRPFKERRKEKGYNT